MISFKEYKVIYESVFMVYESVGKWTHDTSENKDEHIHSSKIHGHNMEVRYFRRGKSNDWDVDFYRNEKITDKDKGNIDPSHRHKMLGFVGHSINHFIKHHKPDAIAMTPTSANRDATYTAFGKALAKKHKGEYSKLIQTSIVYFTGKHK